MWYIYFVDLAVEKISVIFPEDGLLRVETYWSNTVLIKWCYLYKRVFVGMYEIVSNVVSVVDEM